MIPQSFVNHSGFPFSTSTEITTHNWKEEVHIQNLLLSLYSCAKVVLDTEILVTLENHVPILTTWLIMSTVCDLINTILLVIATKAVAPRHHAPAAQDQTDSSQEIEEEVHSLSQSKLFAVMVVVNNCFYYFIVIFCCYLWFGWCFGCFGKFEGINAIMCYTLCFGMLYMVFCFLQAIIARKFSYMFTFSLIEFRKPHSNLRKTSFFKLNRKLFSAEIEQNECHICLLPYKEGEKLCELPCSTKHHFHESCIKKWLEVKDVCPLCRKPIVISAPKIPTFSFAIEIQSLN